MLPLLDRINDVWLEVAGATIVYTNLAYDMYSWVYDVLPKGIFFLHLVLYSTILDLASNNAWGLQILRFHWRVFLYFSACRNYAFFYTYTPQFQGIIMLVYSVVFSERIRELSKVIDSIKTRYCKFSCLSRGSCWIKPVHKQLQMALPNTKNYGPLKSASCVSKPKCIKIPFNKSGVSALSCN